MRRSPHSVRSRTPISASWLMDGSWVSPASSSKASGSTGSCSPLPSVGVGSSGATPSMAVMLEDLRPRPVRNPSPDMVTDTAWPLRTPPNRTWVGEDTDALVTRTASVTSSHPSQRATSAALTRFSQEACGLPTAGSRSHGSATRLR